MLNVTKDPQLAIFGALNSPASGDALGIPSGLWPLQQVHGYLGCVANFLPCLAGGQR